MSLHTFIIFSVIFLFILGVVSLVLVKTKTKEDGEPPDEIYPLY